MRGYPRQRRRYLDAWGEKGIFDRILLALDFIVGGGRLTLSIWGRAEKVLREGITQEVREEYGQGLEQAQLVISEQTEIIAELRLEVKRARSGGRKG